MAALGVHVCRVGGVALLAGEVAALKARSTGVGTAGASCRTVSLTVRTVLLVFAPIGLRLLRQWLEIRFQGVGYVGLADLEQIGWDGITSLYLER